MRKSTMIDLPNEIEALIPENERTPLIHQILTESKAGEFHDYKNEKYVEGKTQLIGMLHQYTMETGDTRLCKIMDAIFKGEYDEPADEADMAMMKRDWIEGGGTEESFNKFLGGN